MAKKSILSPLKLTLNVLRHLKITSEVSALSLNAVVRIYVQLYISFKEAKNQSYQLAKKLI